MDRQHAPTAQDILLTAPVIQRAGEQSHAEEQSRAVKTNSVETPESFVPAAQSKVLNALLGSAWVFKLVTIFTATTTGEPGEAAPVLLVGFATALLLGLTFAMATAVIFAAKNDARTAPLSFAIATGMIVFVTLCGLAGHPASTWLGDLAFGAVVAAGSVAVFARRA